MAATIELERIRTHPDVYATTIPEGVSVSEVIALGIMALEDAEVDEIEPLYHSVPVVELDSMAERFDQSSYLSFETHGYTIEIMDFNTVTFSKLFKSDTVLEDFMPKAG